MKEMRLYSCPVCGNLMLTLEDGGVVPECCGSEMVQIYPNTVDASAEKHVPVAEREGDTLRVRVGSAPHPMAEEHSILWIAVLSERGAQMKRLSPGDEPEAVFAFTKADLPRTAYAYCNLHGLWKSDIS